MATDDLTVLIEMHDADLDPYADLSAYGADAEGATELFHDRGPKVSISERIAADERRENRFRTTLTHEFGHPRDHLARFRGFMHADGYAGFEDLYRSGGIREVACMAHVRRRFVDIHRSQASPIAEEAIKRIARLYAVEKEARGSPPERRVARPAAHSYLRQVASGSTPQFSLPFLCLNG